MVDWIYGNPTWLWGGIFIFAVTALVCAGLAIFCRLVDVEIRRKHNDIAAACMSIVGIAYAVLVAFIAVATWEAFGDADKIVATEASYIGNLYRDTTGLAQDNADSIKTEIKSYLRVLMSEEWPAQQDGRSNHSGREPLARIHAKVASLNPTTPGEAVIMAELLDTLNDLYSARRNRQLAAEGAVPETLWWIIAFGTVMTLGFMYFFGAPDFRMHLAMTAVVAASMALVIVLVIALDRPFRGDLSVSTEAYKLIEDSVLSAENRGRG